MWLFCFSISSVANWVDITGRFLLMGEPVGPFWVCWIVGNGPILAALGWGTRMELQFKAG